MNKTIFITGITGYIGGTIAVKLKEKGYKVLGLVRNDNNTDVLEKSGIQCIKATLHDIDILYKAISISDAVIHTADSDDAQVVDNFLSILKGTNKTFIYTSGSNIIANWEKPETAEFVYTEDFPLNTNFSAGHRVLINQQILRSAIDGVRSIVIVPSMVYGTGLLINKESKQIPILIKTAKEKNSAVYVGKGTHCWSNVHVEDLAELYILALEKAKPGSYFFAENGITSFKDIADAIQYRLNLKGNSISLNKTEAIETWGEMMATVAFGSDCRLNADKARLFLEWKPTHNSVLEWIKSF